MEAVHEEMPFDLDFHPSSPLVATSLITGEFYLFRYASESQPERLFATKAHKESCRAVRFVDSGKVILTGSADCSILASDVETGKAIARLEDAHENGINRLVCLTETTIASGDDEGCIKVWVFSRGDTMLLPFTHGSKTTSTRPSGIKSTSLYQRHTDVHTPQTSFEHSIRPYGIQLVRTTTPRLNQNLSRDLAPVLHLHKWHTYKLQQISGNW